MPAADVTRWFKRAQRGLFAGKQRLTGNHVSPSKRHVRRYWLPNVQRKHLWSAGLGRPVRINVTTAAMRLMDRMGGLDQYLLGTPARKLGSQVGVTLQTMLRQRLAAGGASAPLTPAPAPPPTRPNGQRRFDMKAYFASKAAGAGGAGQGSGTDQLR